MKNLIPVLLITILFSCSNEKESSIQYDDGIIVNIDNPNVVINDSISNTEGTLSIDTNLSNKANFIADTNYKTVSHKIEFSECPKELKTALINYDEEDYKTNQLLTKYLINFNSKIEKNLFKNIHYQNKSGVH